MTDIGNVLIVGSSASVGPEIVAQYATSAAKIIATYNSQKPTYTLPNIVAKKMDLRSANDRHDLVSYIPRQADGIDVAVFMTGIIMGQPLAQYTDQQAYDVMTVNFTAQALLIRDLLPIFNKGARILLIGSIASERGSYDPIYAASKGALIPFGKSLATAHGEKISVNVVLPGPIEDSTMFDEMSSDTRSKHRQQSPRKELLNRQDFARILVDMSQQHWSHTNGAIIRVNGASYV